MARPAPDHALDLARQATAGHRLAPEEVVELARAYLQFARDLDRARRTLAQLRGPMRGLRDGLAEAYDAYKNGGPEGPPSG